ncbi:hypothetical protein CPT_Pollock29 [Escherichia phage Pollock]|uniref:Uncharacterized protein n=1 Tax=Escherichia phage Pollock TaxID=1540097 RepID=A0A0A0YU52_9CAUD|nr:hypothetical protein ACQ44_gp29 [Escherichia phage Pollock]AIX12388.1 hypothetical protein CPT_Pollock29 [Escherichia phage Pollock]
MSKPKIEIEKIDALRNAFNAMYVSHQEISVGDIVILHPSVPGIFKVPTEERPGIVTKFLPKPMYAYEMADDTRPSHPSSAIQYDCVINIINDDGEIVPFLMDSRRLLKVN